MKNQSVRLGLSYLLPFCLSVIPVSVFAFSGQVSLMSDDAVATIDTKDGHRPLTINTQLRDEDEIVVHQGVVKIVYGNGSCQLTLKKNNRLKITGLEDRGCGRLVVINDANVTLGNGATTHVGSASAGVSLGAATKMLLVAGGVLAVVAAQDSSKASPD